FLELCYMPQYMPVHRNTVEKHATDWTKPDNIVSNGPFELRTWSPEKKIILVRSDTYWDNERVALRKVTIQPIDAKDACKWILVETSGSSAEESTCLRGRARRREVGRRDRRRR